MTILGICTVFTKGYIALFNENGKVIDEILLEASCKQSENCLPSIDKILNRNNLKLSDIDCLSVSIGPGSFTGIRVGLAIVKGFMSALDLKCVAINSFEMLSLGSEKQLPCLINALSGNVFLGELDKNLNEIKSPTCEKLENISNYGSDFLIHYADKEMFATFTESDWQSGFVKASVLKNKNKDYKSINEIAALYLRNSQAEENLKNNV